MLVKIKPAGNFFIIAALVIAAVLSVIFYKSSPKTVAPSLKVCRVTLPYCIEAILNRNAILFYMKPKAAAINTTIPITLGRTVWNSQFSGMPANGEIRNTKITRLNDAKLDFTSVRQDDQNGANEKLCNKNEKVKTHSLNSYIRTAKSKSSTGVLSDHELNILIKRAVDIIKKESHDDTLFKAGYLNRAKRIAIGFNKNVCIEKRLVYSLKYYNDMEEKDIQGMKVNLGGSTISNLSDIARIFGLGEYKIDNYKSANNVFYDLHFETCQLMKLGFNIGEVTADNSPPSNSIQLFIAPITLLQHFSLKALPHNILLYFSLSAGPMLYLIIMISLFVIIEIFYFRKRIAFVLNKYSYILPVINGIILILSLTARDCGWLKLSPFAFSSAMFLMTCFLTVLMKKDDTAKKFRKPFNEEEVYVRSDRSKWKFIRRKCNSTFLNNGIEEIKKNPVSSINSVTQLISLGIEVYKILHKS